MVVDLGIVGLGVMGRNLALNLADHGYGVALYDPWPEARAAIGQSDAWARPELLIGESIEDLVAAVAPPRAIVLLVKAGAAVDAQLSALVPLLAPGDLLADAGNSRHGDSQRRAAALAGQGIGYLDVGLSGGGEGARHGPCLMVGGEAAHYARLGDLLETVAARAAGAACAAHVGPSGAGHFVKMVHNGIEYAVMQAIGEVYLLLRDGLGLAAGEMAALFTDWQAGPLKSYLLEVTIDVLGRADPASGQPLVELIQDQAGQKGTGAWAAAAALELGVPAPALLEAVAARGLSAIRGQRLKAAELLAGPEAGGGSLAPERLREALETATIGAYAQGFALLAAAEAAHGWAFDLARIARLWQGGCILQAAFLTEAAAAFAEPEARENLVLARAVAARLSQCQEGLRSSLIFGQRQGLPLPVLGASLAWYDGYRNTRLWASLIQAQRDRFGAHGFQRVDQPGIHHLDPAEPGGQGKA